MITTEARWFVRGPLPEHVRAWFDQFDPGEPSERTDLYLAPTDAALGAKWREGQVELKRRVWQEPHALRVGQSVGHVEGWQKWSFALESGPADRDALEGDDQWLAVHKTRRLAQLVEGEASCGIELCEVEVRGLTLWTVNLEAQGGDRAARDAALREAAEQALGHRGAPALVMQQAAGYAGLLLELVGKEDGTI